MKRVVAVMALLGITLSGQAAADPSDLPQGQFSAKPGSGAIVTGATVRGGGRD